MEKTSQTRILATALGLATLLICVLGALNFIRETNYEQPTDGVWWLESQGGLKAERVPLDSPAHREGVRTGDILTEANTRPTPTVAPLQREMLRSGTWNRIRYSLLRNGSPLDIQVILEPTDRTRNQGLRLIALVYLAIGLYVLFRRWTAPKATHFYLFCLVSGVLYAFRYTGQFDTMDWLFFWGNVLATALQPALFLHFAVTFGEARSSLRRRLFSALLYVPGFCSCFCTSAPSQAGWPRNGSATGSTRSTSPTWRSTTSSPPPSSGSATAAPAKRWNASNSSG